MIKLLTLLAALTVPLMGQTYYSPNGLGSVGNISGTGNSKTSADVFVWDINSNSTASGFDTYTANGQANLTIDGWNGEFMRVVLGSNVDINDAFWGVDQSWSDFITKNGSNTTIPNLNQSKVYAYTYSNGTFNLLDVSSFGEFSLYDNKLYWTSVPEPTGLLFFMASSLILLRRKR
jgi:hypothetical protein